MMSCHDDWGPGKAYSRSGIVTLLKSIKLPPCKCNVDEYENATRVFGEENERNMWSIDCVFYQLWNFSVRRGVSLYIHCLELV